jgi:hypothetical protein
MQNTAASGLDRKVALRQLRAFEVSAAPSRVHPAQPSSRAAASDSRPFAHRPRQPALGKQAASPRHACIESDHARVPCGGSTDPHNSPGMKDLPVNRTQLRRGAAALADDNGSDGTGASQIVSSGSWHACDDREAGVAANTRQTEQPPYSRSQAAPHTVHPYPCGPRHQRAAVHSATSQRSEDENVPALANSAPVSSKTMPVVPPEATSSSSPSPQRQKQPQTPPHQCSQKPVLPTGIKHPSSEFPEGRDAHLPAQSVAVAPEAAAGQDCEEAGQWHARECLYVEQTGLAATDSQASHGRQLSVQQPQGKGATAPLGLLHSSSTQGEWQAHELRLEALEATLLKHAHSAGHSLLVHSREKVSPGTS